MKKLPIGISTLKTIIEENYLYVDKTKIALELIENGQYYFLSRPRRFGKSLFLDTLKTIFNADKEVFKGLYIYDKYDWSKKYPVIHISFAAGNPATKEDIQAKLYEIMDTNQRHLDISCPENFSLSGCFKRMIEEAYTKHNQKVVILIDEYDKPILDNIENTEVATQAREILKDFYSVIKGSDEYIKFVFITGVSKFSKISLFSGLNNLDDITIDPNYSTICGYTQNDVETVFAKHLAGQDFTKIKHWYNGYKWLGEGVYNPFDILLFISKNFIYKNYWFSTGTPTFLLKLIEKNNYFLPDLENIVKDESMLESFDVDYIELETLMWQTGYLTIVKTEEGFDGIPLYSLDIPNYEVRSSLINTIGDFMTKIHNPLVLKNNLFNAFKTSDFIIFEREIKSLFASIPYNNFVNNPMHEKEGYYVSVFYAYMKAMGVETIGEDVTNKGRIDLTLKLPNALYIMEFKTDGKDALAQIKERKYYEKYTSSNLPIYLVGIEFDIKEKNVSRLEWERV
ncbi:MAG: AAA family ATPase [Campylobacterales bacterium]|nr:AAA family ATPase [Campylobacterales bacterium]